VNDQISAQRDHPTEPLAPDKSLGELFGDLTSDLGLLFRQEIELAKAEARDELKQAGRGAGMMGGAGLAGWMALVLLSFALAWLLDKVMDRALAFAIVGVAWAIVAAVLAMRAKREMAHFKALPKTVETLKEDARWAKTQTN